MLSVEDGLPDNGKHDYNNYYNEYPNKNFGLKKYLNENFEHFGKHIARKSERVR